MAVFGTHLLLYSSEPEALRAMLRDTFGFSNVDAGDGWLIFAMPPAEMGVHPAEGGLTHQVSFMCDDIDATVADLRGKGVRIEGEPKDEGWGITVLMELPGDARVLLYQPRHPVAISTAGKSR